MTRRAATPDELEAAIRRQPPLHALLTREECAGALQCGIVTFDRLHVRPAEVNGNVAVYLWSDVIEAVTRRQGSVRRVS